MESVYAQMIFMGNFVNITVNNLFLTPLGNESSSFGWVLLVLIFLVIVGVGAYLCLSGKVEKFI